MEYKITLRDESETIELAQNIESEKFYNMVICLNGDLGSGKTVFAKGFASALGIDEVITSPTFNIVKEYTSGEIPLFHMDVYRLDETDVEIDFAFLFLLATQNHIIYTRGIVRMDIFFDQCFTNNNFLSSVSCLTNMHYYDIFI